MRRIVDARAAGGILALFATLLTLAVSGCNQGDGRSKDASPIVSADSEPGKRAIAEAASLARLRKIQEAKIYSRGRKRHHVLPKID